MTTAAAFPWKAEETAPSGSAPFYRGRPSREETGPPTLTKRRTEAEIKEEYDVLKGAGMVALVFIGAAVTNAIAMTVLPPLLGSAAEREFMDVSTFPKYLVMMAIVWTTASFCEEMVFRGFLMSRTVEMLGARRFAWLFAALFQAVLFGLVHAYQGIGGIVTTGMVGLTFGLMYLIAKRNLWPTIIGHGLVNSFGITVLHLQATGAINTSGLG